MLPSVTLENDAYRVAVIQQERGLCLQLLDRAMDSTLADDTAIYRATFPDPSGSLVARWLTDARVQVSGDTLEISGRLGPLTLRQIFRLPHAEPAMEECLYIANETAETVTIEELQIGLQRCVADGVGIVLPDCARGRWVALPFRHRATHPDDYDADFAIADLIERPGRERRATDRPKRFAHGHMPSMQWASEGWAWLYEGRAFCVMSFCQQAITFATLGVEPHDDHLGLRFGGLSMVDGEPASLHAIEPGQQLSFGVTRYETVEGGVEQACYALRRFNDANGCALPPDYDPPVHWNELYDNPEWHLVCPDPDHTPQMTRPQAYTLSHLEAEAQKASDYGCQALYLDPGWDTDFGTFVWGEDWLGPEDVFVDRMREMYGLGVSLHCPLATWTAMDGRGVPSWPRATWQMDREGNIIEGTLCLGSRQYLDAACERLALHCERGVRFLMFDGNWWNAGCWNPDHGHPVPYTKADHARANLELAQRIHERFPDVLIEMHDTISGGSLQRYTPVYYQYGLPGAHDENWGVELMWRPMDDLRSGRARSLYYYNLGCSIPVYLHVDLRDDNIHCLVLWWYASTCRHLGIGGTHADPMVAQAQRLAMGRYRQLEAYYKRGVFYGMHEGAHVHVLPERCAFVINLFNLSDSEQTVEGSISLDEMGLPRDRWYATPQGGSFDAASGRFAIRRLMPPWSAAVLEVESFGTN